MYAHLSQVLVFTGTNAGLVPGSQCLGEIQPGLALPDAAQASVVLFRHSQWLAIKQAIMAGIHVNA